MSSVDAVTALSGYQVQAQQLQAQITAAQNQLQTDVANLSALRSSSSFALINNPSNYDSTGYVGPGGVGLENSIAQQQVTLENSVSSGQSNISSLNTQLTNLNQIISQLQTNITQYDTPKPISSSNPTTASDTAHNIATGFTSLLSSVPKTDLYIGLGVLGLILLLK